MVDAAVAHDGDVIAGRIAEVTILVIVPLDGDGGRDALVAEAAAAGAQCGVCRRKNENDAVGTVAVFATETQPSAVKKRCIQVNGSGGKDGARLPG